MNCLSRAHIRLYCNANTKRYPWKGLLKPPQSRKHCCGNVSKRAGNNVSLPCKQTFSHAQFKKCSQRDPGSSQHCFLGAQTGKHLVRKQSVSEKKNQKHLLLLGNRKCFPNKCLHKRSKHLGRHSSARMFPQQCFLVCRGL